MVEVMISPKASGAAPFYFVSDGYSAAGVRDAIRGNCSDVTVGAPVPFHSTGNPRPDTIVQFYRGDSAAITLERYNNTGGPGGSGLVPNPPFPSNVNASTWACLNYTIGESIPLMNAASSFSTSTVLLGVLLFSPFLRKILDL